MTIFDFLTLVCGLALFLFGMDVMSESLKKSAGNRLKATLGKMTSSKFRGFILGLAVTAIIQSSSATTVMVVGFVNSGTMTLSQAVGVIMGANVGAGITSWITGLSGIGGSAVSSALRWAQPSSWMPIVAIIGTGMLILSKRGKRRDIGTILLGFSVLMVGMETMSGAVSGLKESEAFSTAFTMFENPLLGIMVGTVITALIQSSGASIGILQSLTSTGAITYSAAIPIIMGQNIGTCITALISSAGANKNGKRAALVHLYYNVIGAAVLLLLFYLSNAIFDYGFLSKPIGTMGVAAVHTIFKLLSVILFAPFTNLLEKLAVLSVKDSGSPEEVNLLDERLIQSPSIAIARAADVMSMMAVSSCGAMAKSLGLLWHYDAKTADEIRDAESKADVYEDTLGTYLVKISSAALTEKDSREVTKLLHLIGDFERISDHAVNIVESAEEIEDKKIVFSESANHEVEVLIGAVSEILGLAEKSYGTGDMNIASLVEPLEQTVDSLCSTIRANHIERLQKSECTIEHGFVLSDILTNCERVSDHCSNIAGCVIEISKYDALNMHQYLNKVKKDTAYFDRKYSEYMLKYKL
ncbi:MAG: Na/Pi cotransporter family protein [Clostridiales bacterium]|nr:Na/Pi cotransporter family protein [Clostridiales bacterium]